MGSSMAGLRRVLLIVLITICIFNIAAAVTVAIDDFSQVQQELEQGQENLPQKNKIGWEFAKLVFFLLLLIALAGLVIRFLAKTGTARSQGQFIHIVDEVILGPNRGIALCEVGGKLYGLGITEQNITLLFEIDNPKLLEEIGQEALLNQPSLPGPLSRILRQNTPLGSSGTANTSFSTLMAEQARRLQDVLSGDGEKESTMKKSDHYD